MSNPQIPINLHTRIAFLRKPNGRVLNRILNAFVDDNVTSFRYRELNDGHEVLMGYNNTQKTACKIYHLLPGKRIISKETEIKKFNPKHTNRITISKFFDSTLKTCNKISTITKYYFRGICYRKYKIDKEIVIQNIDDNIALKDSSLTKYLRIILSDIGDELFIKESDADNYRDSALDWKKYFKICKTDTDDDIFCSLEDLESALELTSDEQNIFNSIIQNSISTSELIYLYSSSNSIYKSMADKLRTLVVTHVHELEKSAYDSISDKELKKYKENNEIDFEQYSRFMVYISEIYELVFILQLASSA